MCVCRNRLAIETKRKRVFFPSEERFSCSVSSAFVVTRLFPVWIVFQACVGGETHALRLRVFQKLACDANNFSSRNQCVSRVRSW